METKNSLGAKADNLLKMLEAGINVPPLICIESDDALVKENELMQRIDEHFGACELFSVRSSSNAEDGADYSFAGQFDTFLNVKRESVLDYVERCKGSASSDAVAVYCASKGLDINSVKVNVIVQQMISSDISGVLFTANPMGILNESVIVVGKGTGNNVVEDKVPVTTYYYNTTDNIYYYESMLGAPEIDGGTVHSLMRTAEEIKKLFGKYLDIEFAVKDGEIYILQARPITTLDTSVTVTLDNSNIVESYPGITLPLTEDFVNRMYTGVFRAMISRLIKNKAVLKRYEQTFEQMTASANGRMYYKIDNWYSVLKVLPFGKRIIPVWQDMLGVSKKSVSAGDASVSFITKAAELIRFIKEMLNVQKSNNLLSRKFQIIEHSFKASFDENIPLEQMHKIYTEIETELLEQWDVTLLNDLYTFICAGLLKATLKKSGVHNYSQRANDCISNITNLESMKPVRALARLALEAYADGHISALRSIDTNERAREFLASGTALSLRMNDYIDDYGDRYLQELKLESPTFRTEPLLLIKTMIEYAQSPQRLFSLARGDSSQAANPLENEKIGFLYSKIINAITKAVAGGIRCREISRLNRSRVFGMVRTLFLAAGKQLLNSNSLEDISDVFYLTMDEVFRSGEIDCQIIVARRKEMYECYSLLPVFSRLVFTKKEFSKNLSNVSRAAADGDAVMLKGTPCCSGTVEGEAIVIKNPNEASDTFGKILVAEMTDPGWVFLLANAYGIISEKGSMLSHTAIISRELGIPAVVGVTGATRAIKSGDMIRISGESGEVTILRAAVKKYA